MKKRGGRWDAASSSFAIGVTLTFNIRGWSFRGALLREPGIHNPDALHIIPTCGYGFRARGQGPAPRNDDLDESQLT
jgi:hypothetical protein